MAFTLTYTLTRSDNSAPIAGAEIIAFSESAMTNAIASATTNAFGITTMPLDNGTYYLRRRLAGYSGTNPQTVIIAGVALAASGTLTPIDVSDNATAGFAEIVVRRMLRDLSGYRWDQPVIWYFLNKAGRHLRKKRRDLFLSSGNVDQPWTDIASSTDTLPISTDYVEPLAHWAVWMAMNELDPETLNVQAAQAHRQAFYALLGLQPE